MKPFSSWLNKKKSRFEEHMEEQTNYPKCLNYELCKSTICPGTKSGDFCINCDILFGDWKNGGKYGDAQLKFIDNNECPICLETKRGVSYPRCNHYICLDDMKRIFYGEDTEEPPFPYPELEDDFDMSSGKNKEKYDCDTVIQKWLNECSEIADFSNNKYENEEYLRKCPICRRI